ncbi:DMT family transporter [Aliiroseovarius subalbicans]|uniref:DMT family transporter n=1 Tax=Aliiroseovarius subalbicans TaxID=2925840 RepID=UPI001F587E54|nr:DMT family transporter [Aliiroseovarius subalbicans]MCI2400696.1 DMT family transporter [Aliiroseovarius subalbicans]
MGLSRDAALGHAAMLAFSALVAGSFSLGGLVANEVAPVALMAVRFALAAVVVAGLALATRSFRRADFAAPWRYLLAGGVFAVYFVLMFEGLKTAPPVSTSAVFTLTPIMTAGFGWIILRQVTTRRVMAALAVGALGALWVIFRGDPAALMRFDVGRGEAIYFVGSIAHAAYIPMIRRLNRGESGLAFTFGVLAAGTLVLCAAGAGEIAATPWRDLPSIVWIALAYLVIGSTAISFFLLNTASMRLPAAKVMAYSYLTPSWVIGWELALGHGAPQAIVLVGIAVTLGAVWMLLKD